jgi:hypothetical protein
MSTKTRLANKTIWALEEIIAGALNARAAWRKCQEIAERRMEPLLLANLGRISDDLARIETTAREARQGRYAEATDRHG